MANYQAARALMGKGKSSAKMSAVKNGAKGMSDMAGDPAAYDDRTSIGNQVFGV